MGATPAISRSEAPVTTTPQRRSGRARSRAGGFQLTDRDLELLEFIASQRFVLARHVEAWLQASEVVAYRRLRGLVRSGMVAYARLFARRPGCYRITASGLAVIESTLPRPVIDLRSYRHDLGAVWLWLASREGRFCEADQILSERQMRSDDQRPVPHLDGAPFGIPLGGYARDGRPRLHFPDVLVLRPDKRRVALELELTLKSRKRLEAIIAGYAAEPRIEQVVYQTDSRKVAAALFEVLSMFGLDGQVLVHYLDEGLGRDARSPAWQFGMAGEITR